MAVRNIVLQPSGTMVTAMATGSGAFRAERCDTFEHGGLPLRLQDSRSTVYDPDFSALEWRDPVWRVRAPEPIASRHGSDSDAFRLRKVERGGQSFLGATKAARAGAPTALALACLAVRPGEQGLAGFKVRGDPRRSATPGTIGITPCWVSLDGHAVNRIPVSARSELTGVLESPVARDAGQLISCYFPI